MKQPIRLLWQGEFLVDTGFGRVGEAVLDRLNMITRKNGSRKYEIFVSALAVRQDPYNPQLLMRKPYRVIPMYGPDPMRFMFGQDISGHIVSQTKPDLCLSLGDVWMVQHWHDPHFIPTDMRNTFKWIPYIPVDGAPIPPSWLETFRKADAPVFYSKFAIEEIKKIDPNLKTHMIYHGVDADVFRPVTKAMKNEFKKRQGWEGKFIVGQIGRNQARKYHPYTLLAFKEFAKDKPDALLVLHCSTQDQGWDLSDLITRFGLVGKVFVTGNNNPAQGIPIEQLVQLINVMDVHVLCTCYHPDTDVITPLGSKRIQDIDIGDLVLSHTGKFNKVEKKFKYECKGNMINLDFFGAPSVRLTDNHKILLLKNNIHNDYQKKKLKINTKKQMVWVEAKEAKEGDYMAMPKSKTIIKKDHIHLSDYVSGKVVNNKFYRLGRNQFKSEFIHPSSRGMNDKLILTDNLMWLFGMYIAEGHASMEKGELIFCLNSREIRTRKMIEYVILQTFGLKSRKVYDSRHRLRIIFNSSTISHLFKELFDNHSSRKKIPEFMMFLCHNQQKQLVQGMWQGDGCLWKPKKGGLASEYSTISRNLCYQVWQLCIRLGYRATIRSSRNRIEYKVLIKSDPKFLYEIYHKSYSGKERTKNWIDDDYIYFRIRKIYKYDYSGPIYDLQVERDHTYCATLIGHNSGEGFGLPVLETMACGIPNLTDAYAASKELIEDSEAGETVKSIADLYRGADHNFCRCLTDTKDLAEKLNKLYYDKNLREKYSVNARKFALNMRWEKFVSQWDKLFSSLMGESSDYLDEDITINAEVI